MFSPITPSDMVGPSPVTSNGTDATEIEDEESDNINEGELSPPDTNGPGKSQATVCSAEVSECRADEIAVEKTQYSPT
jgi:hypothetical protein